MFDTLLKAHFAQYPGMRIEDAVKLAHQSAFGCGHMLASHEQCSRHVREEMADVPERADVPVQTELLGGLCRLNLANADVRALSPECMADLMIITDDHVRARGDNLARFEEMLAAARQLALRGEAPFSAHDLERYMLDYPIEQCPPVSHSDAFRRAYHPSYRVVLSDFALLLPVIAEVERRLASERSAVVVLDGACGSGKSTLGRLLGELYGADVLCMDDFFLKWDMRTTERMNEPGGNVHYERFIEEVLDPLLTGDSFCYGGFYCHTGHTEMRTHTSSRVTVIEGSYSHHPAFAEHYARMHALRVLITVDEEEQLRRLAGRNPQYVDMFRTKWIPLERTYFDTFDIAGKADITLHSTPIKGGILH